MKKSANSVPTSKTNRKGRLRVTLPTDVAIGAKSRAKTLGVSVSEYFRDLTHRHIAAVKRFKAIPLTESVVMTGDRIVCTLTSEGSKFVKAAAFADREGDICAWLDEWLHANVECDFTEILDKGLRAAVVVAAGA